jgi:hypothetical protein
MLTSCSKSDTVLALTVNVPTGVETVTTFAVTVTPSSGSPENFSFSGANIGPKVSSVVMRHDLDLSGPAAVVVTAKDCDEDIAGVTVNADFRANETTAVTASLKQLVATLPSCHSGAGGAGGSGGGGGAAGGAGGAAGGANGGAGGANGGAGAAGAPGGSGGKGGGLGGGGGTSAAAGNHGGAGGRAGAGGA